MNNYGEIYLCFYKHDKDFLVGNKNINVAKKIKNYCKTNSSTIQDFFKTKNLQEHQKLIDLFNYQIFKNQQVIINNDKTFPTTYEKKQAVIITFKVDYPNFPATLKQAMLSVCAYLYENAGDCVNENNSQFKSLFFPYIVSQKFIILNANQ
jgi:hypothetical protein